MGLYTKEDFNVIADAAVDHDHWLEARKPLLTSSDIFTFRNVKIPDWWSSHRNDIIDQKFGGKEAKFPRADFVSMNHGTFDEHNIARKFGYAVGCEVQTVNWLVQDREGRWPNLGASIDGFHGPPSSDTAPHPELCQDEGFLHRLCSDVRHLMGEGSRPWLLEIKKSTSSKWKKMAPHYYTDAQNQAQLWILDLPFAVICGETILEKYFYDNGRRYTRKWWDLRPYIVKRNPKWEKTMDTLNAEFARERERWQNGTI